MPRYNNCTLLIFANAKISQQKLLMLPRCQLVITILCIRRSNYYVLSSFYPYKGRYNNYFLIITHSKLSLLSSIGNLLIIIIINISFYIFDVPIDSRIFMTFWL